MNRRQRAAIAAAAIAPVTVARIALINCGCSQAAWTIEILTAVVFGLWVLATTRFMNLCARSRRKARHQHHRQLRCRYGKAKKCCRSRIKTAPAH